MNRLFTSALQTFRRWSSMELKTVSGARSSLVQAINTSKCIVFVKTNCPFCIKTRESLTKFGVNFDLVDLETHAEQRLMQENLYQLTGQRTVPSIFFNGTHLGGNSDLESLINSGKFELFMKNTQVMAELKKLKTHSFDYDLIVIGGGSGGIACAKKAAGLGKKVALFDFVKPSPAGSTWGIGGTCVNVGCIPKKLFHRSALVGESIHYGKSLGWNIEKSTHEWETLVDSVQGHVRSLNFGYKVSLKKLGANYVNAYATLKDAHTVSATDKAGKVTEYTGKFIVLATGERPLYPGLEGDKECCISSDDIFSLGYVPGKTLIIGASYIALECAGVLKGFGYDVDVMVRSIFLRGFDQEMASRIGAYIGKTGVNFLRDSVPLKFENLKKPEGNQPGLVRVTYKTGGEQKVGEYNTVILAIGREACTKNIGLEKLGIQLDGRNRVRGVAETEMTEVGNIFAVGDILSGKPQLTPMAIKSGSRLADRLFSDDHFDKCDYSNVATTVFTPLEYGCIGLSEEDAIKQFGKDVTVYHNYIHYLESTVIDDSDPADYYAKLITLDSRGGKVIGFHVISPNAGEITQGFALAMKMGATFKDFSNVVGIHPTCAEVFTTLTSTKGSKEPLEASGC